MKRLFAYNLFSPAADQLDCGWRAYRESFNLAASIAGPGADAGTAASVRQLNLEPNLTSGRRRRQLAPT